MESKLKVADLADLQDRVVKVVRASPIGGRVRNVSVEAEDEGVGGPFLRIVVEMIDLEKLAEEEAEPVVRSIEGAVEELDERFPSVRFADAA